MQAGLLRLLAEDVDGLGVIAAAVQDALARPQDIKFNRRARSFGLEINRFQWERAGRKRPWFRSRAVLAFAGVLEVKSQGVPRGIDDVLALLSITFTPDPDPPGGLVTLVFAQKAEVRLKVECIDVTLMDEGAVWPTRRRPDHGVAS
ncbi:MAG: DUF2948 family protein [Alphaproteobacteria bacterium]|nr:DUF2948 family protein [Alphaproteobacteria bacterium]